jgi:hypothetical protein
MELTEVIKESSTTVLDTDVAVINYATDVYNDKYNIKG